MVELPTPEPSTPAPPNAALRQFLTLVLSACLLLFFADAVVSLADDTLIVFFDLHILTLLRGTVFCLAMLVSVLVYILMGLTPMVPKRIFLPLTLFNPVVMLLSLLLAIFFYDRFERIAWVCSLWQVALAVFMLSWAQGRLRPRWPALEPDRLGSRGFSWANLSAFLLVNLLVLLPASIVYLAVCAALAVSHFSDGFLSLRPSGFTVQVRKYVRDDGKSIQLVPMAHVGERDFYHQLSHAFPTNAVVLMEGVTDSQNLLTNKVTYQRMAKSLGLSEQQEEFNPVQVEMVMADVDVAEFTTNTIGFLNLMMLVHGKGWNAENVFKLVSFSPPPHFERELWDDLLHKRNDHVLKEIQDRLSDPQPIVIPWGVAHMPGIAEGILASGFRLAETREQQVISFRSRPASSRGRLSKPVPR